MAAHRAAMLFAATACWVRAQRRLLSLLSYRTLTCAPPDSEATSDTLFVRTLHRHILRRVWARAVLDYTSANADPESAVSTTSAWSQRMAELARERDSVACRAHHHRDDAATSSRSPSPSRSRSPSLHPSLSVAPFYYRCHRCNFNACAQCCRGSLQSIASSRLVHTLIRWCCSSRLEPRVAYRHSSDSTI